MIRNTADYQYLNMLEFISGHGFDKGDRTGTGTRSFFGPPQMRFSLEENFPLLTTKKIPFSSIVHELLWFISGDTNIKYLVDNKVNIWNEWPAKAYLIKNNRNVPSPDSEDWEQGLARFTNRIKTEPGFAEEYGELGPVYGHQWRSWPTSNGESIDQLTQVINQIKNYPNSRRMIISAWNVADIEMMAVSALPPCHCLFQFYVADGKLSCQLYQRSADLFLGVPFNIASYALLTCMIAQVCGLKPGDFIWLGGDTHIYNNHFEQVAIQLERRAQMPDSPTLWLNPEVTSVYDFRFNDIKIIDYKPLGVISAPIAV